MEAFLKTNLLGAVVPAIITAITVLAFAQPWQEEKNSKRGHWSLVLGLAMGYAFAYWAIVGEIPSFPVDLEEYEADSQLIYISGVLVVLSFISTIFDTYQIKSLAILSISLLTGWLIIPEWIVEEGESRAILWYWRIGYTLTALLLFAMLEKLTKTVKQQPFSLICFCITAIASGVLVMSANAKLAQLLGTIAAMSMALFCMGFLCKGISWRNSGVYFIAIFLPGILINGYLSAETSIIPFILIVLSPILVFCSQWWKSATPLKLAISQITLALVPLLAALIISYQNYTPS